MGLYGKMLTKHNYTEIREASAIPNDLHGLWLGDLILIKRNLSKTHKAEVLYRELTHRKLTYGNILDQSKFNNRKFENYARRYGYEDALPLRIIVEAHNYGISNLYELAEYIQLNGEYIVEILKHYKNRHGIGTHYGEYLVTFDSLRIFRYKEI